MHPPNPFRATRDRLLGYALLASGMALVGTYVALSRPLTEVFPVFLLAWLRFGIAAAAMLPWLARPDDEPAIDRRVWRDLVLLSFFGNFLFSIFMLFGVALSGATTAGVVLAAIPALVAFLSWWILGERLQWRIGLAIALAVAGMLMLSLNPANLSTLREATASGAETASGPATASWLGPLLLFGCACCEALYVILGKGLSSILSARRISALINLVGWALMTPLGVWQALDFDFAAVGASSWALLVFYALAASMISTWLWLSGLRHVPASHGGVFALAMPLAASGVGVLVLNEAFSMTFAVALGCACAGILLVAWPTGTRAG
jgi:drug/metabolite transporter (DMT)-like permease